MKVSVDIVADVGYNIVADIVADIVSDVVYTILPDNIVPVGSCSGNNGHQCQRGVYYIVYNIL